MKWCTDIGGSDSADPLAFPLVASAGLQSWFRISVLLVETHVITGAGVLLVACWQEWGNVLKWSVVCMRLQDVMLNHNQLIINLCHLDSAMTSCVKYVLLVCIVYEAFGAHCILCTCRMRLFVLSRDKQHVPLCVPETNGEETMPTRLKLALCWLDFRAHPGGTCKLRPRHRELLV